MFDTMRFRNRAEAGRILAERLSVEVAASDMGRRPLVLALPRGGVPVAREVALRLNAPLEVLVVRKIGAPENPEFGIGAITESGYFWINPEAVGDLRVDADEMEKSITAEFMDVSREVDRFRGGRSLPDLRGRTAIVVDDGIATGVTAVVAARYLRSQGASRIIVAAPVCAKDTLPLLKKEADQVICLETPEMFSAVGLWYEDFSQLTDDEVVRLLNTPAEPAGMDLSLSRDLALPRGSFEGKEPRGLVLFAHGSGSSRFSLRNRHVAQQLHEAGFATILFDLLTEEESANRERVFDIPFLAERLIQATGSAMRALSERGFPEVPIGYFGASTGAAAALWAAADLGTQIHAIVSRGGRPDLAGSRLTEVRAPTLLIVGSRDHPVIEMNTRALHRLPDAEMVLIEGATHLFEEEGALEEVGKQAIRWFEAHLGSPLARARRSGHKAA